LYNVNITPVIAVDDINAVVTKTLNGKPYNGETITVDGIHQLVVTAVDLLGNLSKETINFTIDKTAPLITVNIVNGSIFERLDSINIVTLVEDTTSGINTLEITLDGAKISNNETVKLDTLALRNHQIVITAVDKAGNTARKEVNFTITVSKESLTNLLEKFYNEGLIKNKGIYNSLNTKLSKGNFKAFTHELLAQKGKGVDEHAANVLLDYVNWIN
jgi:lactocepin